MSVMPVPPIEHELSLLAINLTRRCNLACDHCYLDAHSLKHGSPFELTTDEVCRLLDEVVQCGEGPMVVLTGGEPLMRGDLEEIITYGTATRALSEARRRTWFRYQRRFNGCGTP
jgi:MoaA/NifB/PqqE/SkfB family radical SAM enzyme